MIDLTKLPPADAERIAYAEGFTGVGELFARISDLEHALHMMEEKEWIGLTDDERYEMLKKTDWSHDPESYAVLVEARLKELNT
jgi:hypothetical protein